MDGRNGSPQHSKGGNVSVWSLFDFMPETETNERQHKLHFDRKIEKTLREKRKIDPSTHSELVVPHT